MDETRTNLAFYGVNNPRTSMILSRPGKEDVDIIKCFPVMSFSFAVTAGEDKDGTITLEIGTWPFFGIETGMFKIPENNLRCAAAAHGFKLVAIDGQELEELRNELDFEELPRSKVYGSDSTVATFEQVE